MAIVVVDAIEDAMRPKRRAILAHAPPLTFVTTYLLGDPQRPCGDAVGFVFRGIERRQVHAEHLVPVIALDALRAGIPAGDVTLAIEHEDRTIPHALNE